MSMSVSPPSSVTKTSPWAMGFIVPASKFRYGSTFMQLTLRPESWISFAIEEVEMPLPSPDMTPPVTKTYFGLVRLTVLLVLSVITLGKSLGWMGEKINLLAHDSPAHARVAVK